MKPTLVGCLLGLIIWNIAGATGPYGPPPVWPDPTQFDRTIEVLSVSDHLPDRPTYPYLGESLVLGVSVQAGDTIIWKHNDTVVQQSSSAEFNLPSLTSDQAGNYRAVIVRGDIAITSEPFVLNVATRPVGSAVDTMFQAETITGFAGYPRMVRPDGWIALTLATPTLSAASWVWVSPDGTEIEEIYARPGSVDSAQPRAFYADGTYLDSNPRNPTLHFPDHTSRPVLAPADLFTTASFVLKQPDHSWIVADPVNLILIDPAGDITFTGNVSDYGFITIEGLREVPSGGGRFLIIGGVGDDISTYAREALLLEADGRPVANFQRISYSNTPPVRLADDTWAHFEAGVLRTFDALGNLTFETTIPELAAGVPSPVYTAISPDGWLYTTLFSVGVTRYDLQGRRDQDYSFAIPPDSSFAGRSIIFDAQSRPLLAIDPATAPPTLSTKLIRLGTDASVGGASPVAEAFSQDAREHGQPLTLIAQAVGTGPFAYEWLNLDGAVLPGSTTEPTLHFPAFAAIHLGRYQLKVTSASGSAFSDIIDLRASSRPQLGNLSGRGHVSVTQELVAGFVVEDTLPPGISAIPATAKLLLRAIGPTLGDFDVADPLADPELWVENRLTGATYSNDDWVPLNSIDELLRYLRGVFDLPAGSADAHLAADLAPGIFTSTVRAKPDDAGIALAEIHSLSLGSTAELANLSLRGLVGAGDDVLIGGFIVEDPENFNRPLRLLLRAVGPTLNAFDVPGICPDPRLTLFNAAGEVIATNDNWGSDEAEEEIRTVAATLGAFALPTDSLDAALLIELPPGTYTAHVARSGTSDGGEALFEIYRLPSD